jgi:hypothetical protein
VTSDADMANPGTVDEELVRIAEMVQTAATATAQLWRDSMDGDRAARLIEVSHALHRAALALADVGLIGDADDEAQVPWLAPPRPGDPAIDLRAAAP